MATDQPAVTVIVTRQAQPGRESDFRRWNQRLIAAAQRSRGFIHQEVQPPDAVHPNEWINIYRFDTRDNLEAWLASKERARLMQDGAELVDGPADEHRIAEPGHGAGQVTAVVSKRVPAGSLRAFRHAQADLDDVMRSFPGFVRSEISEPMPGVQDDHVTLFTFDSRQNLDNWLRSDERSVALGLLDDLIEGNFTLSVVSGFGGWFEEQGHAPARWKQAVTVLVALFPTLLVLREVQNVIAPDVPWLPALFVSNVASIAILTWVLMPLLTKWLQPWLQR